MTTTAERVRQHRARRASGGAVLLVVVADEIATIEMLAAAGVLDPSQADDAASVAAALGKMIDGYAARHRLETQ